MIRRRVALVPVAVLFACGGVSPLGSNSGDDTGDVDESSGGATTLPATDTSDGTSSVGGTSADAGSSTSAADDGSTESTGSTGGGSSTEAGSSTTAEPSASSSGGDTPLVCPDPPATLTRWQVGDEADLDVAPSGPALVLMGGGPDVDDAFVWWQQWIAGGDVVVLRASGADGYNDYLLDFGGDSVETLLVDTVTLADDPYVGCRIAQAEAVFLTGGDQAEYMTLWKDHGVADALMSAWDRGAVIGGTSAGLAVLGEHVFAAYNDTVYSYEALEDPYNEYMTMDAGMLALPSLGGIITDSHFADRDRMGRLVGFLARIVQDGTDDDPIGIGVDEGTALLVEPDGEGTVVGDGSVYVLHAAGVPSVCAAGEPLTYEDLELVRLDAGDTITLPAGATAVASSTLSAVEGALEPADPY
ncbi:MAG: cyanophycinase [Deltaproteobacteria bacterium]|nr:cyanophycinase [Nannocystaceae bacterium]